MATNQQITSNTDLTSKAFHDIKPGMHFMWKSDESGSMDYDTEYVKTGEKMARLVEDGVEPPSWVDGWDGEEIRVERSYTAMIPRQHTRRLEEGERVRVIRHTSRQISSSESVVTGEESFEGVVNSTWEQGAFIVGDDGEYQACRPYLGDEHGAPVKKVELPQ